MRLLGKLVADSKNASGQRSGKIIVPLLTSQHARESVLRTQTREPEANLVPMLDGLNRRPQRAYTLANDTQPED
jgi:hypothetical protein